MTNEKTFNKVDEVISQLKHQFENSPYILDSKLDENDNYPADQYLMSVILPARNEFPSIVFTIHNIWAVWEAEGHDPNQLEIIIVDNGSSGWTKDDDFYSRPGVTGTVEYLMQRGGYWNRKLKVVKYPICGNHAARNIGAKEARGRHIFFSDGHMSYRPGFFTLMMKSLEDNNGGLFHGAIAWMGAQPATPSSTGCTYTMKIGDGDFRGTWANYYISTEEYFFIPSLGHCSDGCYRKEFNDFGGYVNYHRTYGGGEVALDFLFWMMGSSVIIHPQAIGYHLASSRGYSYDTKDYKHNIFNCLYMLGADDWLDRAYIQYLRKFPKDKLDFILEEAKKEMTPRRAEIEEKRKFTVNEVLINKPWKQKNIKKFGKGNDNILVYHPTWLEELKKENPAVIKYYNNSHHMKNLDKLIKENFWDLVYHKDKFNIKTNFTKI